MRWVVKEEQIIGSVEAPNLRQAQEQAKARWGSSSSLRVQAAVSAAIEAVEAGELSVRPPAQNRNSTQENESHGSTTA